MKLFFKSNISELPTPNTPDKKYLYNLLKHGLNYYINNCNAKLALLEYQNKLIPIVIANYENMQTYLTSIISSYINYPDNVINNKFLHPAYVFCENLLKFTQTDNVLYVNHKLISTNIHEGFSSEQIHEISNFLKLHFPKHAIVFRNIAKETNENLFYALKQNKYKFIYNRKSYLITNKDFPRTLKKQSFKKDLALAKKSRFKLKEILFPENNNLDTLKILYEKLYIKKYTQLNPQYNNNFFNMILDVKNGNIYSLDYENKIFGYYYSLTANNYMVMPMLGYDTALSNKEGLYRLLLLDAISKAYKQSYHLNLSSGVGDYKIRRGAKPYWEYLAIDYSHLNIFRKLSYFLLTQITNKISIVLIEKFKVKVF